MGTEKFFAGLTAGESVFSTRKFSDEHSITLPALYAAYLEDFSAADYLGRKGLRNLSRESKLFMSAAMMACEDANLSPQLWERQRVGVCCGSVFSGYDDYVRLFTDGLVYGVDRINPAQGPQTGFNAPASQLAIHVGAEGPNITVTTGIASGLDALAYGSDLIEGQHADILLAGGVEAYSFFSARALVSSYRMSDDSQPPKPFDLKRRGTVYGEAASIIALEGYEHARARGAKVLAEVSGYGRAFNPPQAGLEAAAGRAIREAMTYAGVDASDLDVIVASGSGDRQLDAAEASVLYEIFADRTPVYGLKGSTGECLGASGALQVAAALLCIGKKIIPKTVGYSLRDPTLPPLSITSEARPARVGHVLVHSLDPGGYATALILRAPEDRSES